MQIRMLNNVSPTEYGLAGQYGWSDCVQWRKGEILGSANFDNADLMHDLVFNGDAKYVEDSHD